MTHHGIFAARTATAKLDRSETDAARHVRRRRGERSIGWASACAFGVDKAQQRCRRCERIQRWTQEKGAGRVVAAPRLPGSNVVRASWGRKPEGLINKIGLRHWSRRCKLAAGAKDERFNALLGVAEARGDERTHPGAKRGRGRAQACATSLRESAQEYRDRHQSPLDRRHRRQGLGGVAQTRIVFVFGKLGEAS